MGNVGSASAGASLLSQSDPLLTDFLSSCGTSAPNATRHPPLPVFRAYVDACFSYGGVLRASGSTVLQPASHAATSSNGSSSSSTMDDGHRASWGPMPSSAAPSTRRQRGDWFRRECSATLPTVHRTYLLRGQRSFVHNGIFYYILQPQQQEVKWFTAHMKGLETVQFLSLPDVMVPETAIGYYLGIHVACIVMSPLYTPCSLKRPATTGGGGGSTASRHATLTKMIVAKVLRLKVAEAPLLMYETGDGRLVVVDATCLLPELCVLPFRRAGEGFAGCVVRSELLIGSDLASITAIPNGLVAEAAAPFLPPEQRGGGEGHLLRLLLDLAKPSKKRPIGTIPVPTLNALFALQLGGGGHPTSGNATGGAGGGNQGPLCLHQQLTVASAATVTPPLVEERSFEIHRPAMRSVAEDNQPLTFHLLQRVIPSFADLCDTLPDDMGPAEFVALLHLAGINISLLGALFQRLHQRSALSRNNHPLSTRGGGPNSGKSRVAAEMICRAGKRWLQKKVLQEPSALEEHLMTLLRGIPTPAFYEAELVPLMKSMFALPLDVAAVADSITSAPFVLPESGDAPFRVLFERVQQLTGVVIHNGRLQSVSPLIRLARYDFTLSESDEAAVCTAAMKRMDGLAGTSLVAAASWWAQNPQRLVKLVEQLGQRVRSSANPTSEGTILTFSFLSEMQALLSRLVRQLARRNGTATATAGGAASGGSVSAVSNNTIPEFLLQDVPLLLGLYNQTMHDRLHITRTYLPIVEQRLRDSTATTNGVLLLRHVLQLGVLTDPGQYHPVAARELTEKLYIASVEACFIAKQADEALSIAQRWGRACPHLFGTRSRENCQAVKTILSALVSTRSRRAELIPWATAHVRLCEETFGLRDARTASSWNQFGSLTWKSDPVLGLKYFRRALALYRDITGSHSRPVCTLLYNMGLALARRNRLVEALTHIRMAKGLAVALQELSTAHMCDVSEKTVQAIAAMKLQRWYREVHYGQVQSQSTRTEDVTTRCSTLSWSDERDEIASSIADT